MCKQIHAEAIDVLYKYSVFHFWTGILGVVDLVGVTTRTSDGITWLTWEESHRNPKEFVPISVWYPPLFCYRPRSHIHMIRNIHLVHPMERRAYTLSEYYDWKHPRKDEEISGPDVSIATYLTILKDTCPHLRTLTLEFAYKKYLRISHLRRSPRTMTYLEEVKIIRQDTISLLEQLLPQLRQVRLVLAGFRPSFDKFEFLTSLWAMLSDRGGVREIIRETVLCPGDGSADTTTLTQPPAKDASEI